MAWQTSMTLMTRLLIADLADPPTYSDTRLQQLILLGARYVQQDVSFSTTYSVNIDSLTLSPDPTDSQSLNDVFTNLVVLKAACIADESTFRTKAVNEGIRTALASADLSVQGNLRGYQILLEEGPCSLYSRMRMEYQIGNTQLVRAVLGPFVGNNFDPRYLLRGAFRSTSTNDFYS
jgi:hypothetical protein